MTESKSSRTYVSLKLPRFYKEFTRILARNLAEILARIVIGFYLEITMMLLGSLS